MRLGNAEAALARTLIRADAPGTVVIDDPDAWAGRPVRTGERVLRLVDPMDVEVAIRIAPADLIDLPPDAPVTVHLDAAPLRPLRATLRRVGTVAVERPDGSLAYEARARIEGVERTNRTARLGARGVARLSGERVPLLYLAVRRPLAMLRQATGW